MSAHALPEVSVQIAGLKLQDCSALSKAATLQRLINKRDSASKKHNHHHQSANTGLQDCWRAHPPLCTATPNHTRHLTQRNADANTCCKASF